MVVVIGEDDRRAVTAERFPMLTPTELDVCRMVEQGKTLRQIADAMGIPVRTVTREIQTGLSRLRKALRDYLPALLLLAALFQ